MDSTDNENIIHPFITMIEKLSDPWGIKDAESRHVYMNKAAYLYTNTPPSFKIEGRSDVEFPEKWSDYAEEFCKQDKRVEGSGDRVTVIETHYWYGRDHMTPFICDKFPIYSKENNYIGCLWNAKPLDTLSPLQYINEQKFSVLTTAVNHPLFTKSEQDTIFLLLQKFSVKEIARIYKITAKTVENKIYNIYQKADVHSSHQFEEYCKKEGLDNYIPERLIKRGVRFI